MKPEDYNKKQMQRSLDLLAMMAGLFSGSLVVYYIETYLSH